MPEDVPSDVQSVLTQLFEETETAIRADDFDTARQTIETATTVSRNKLPEGDLRAWLLHGCGEVLAAITLENGVESDVAVAYVQAMVRRLPDQ